MSFQKIYETDRLYVRPLTEKDILSEHYQSWFYDPEITKYNSHGLFPYTEEQKKEFIERVNSGKEIIWAVIVKEIEENILEASTQIEIHIGNMALQSIDWVNRCAEFAVVIGEKGYWGKGYTTEAAQLLFKHGFERLNLNRIWTGTAETNFGMRSVAGKLGMSEEGCFRNAVYLNGSYCNIVEFGILKEEWEESRPVKKVNEEFPLVKGTGTRKEPQGVVTFTQYEDELENKNSEKSDEFIVEAIKEVRTKNNLNWMSILQVALKNSPEETKEILYNINKSDNKISDLVSQLCSKEK